jgi:hypothetical protein
VLKVWNVVYENIRKLAGMGYATHIYGKTNSSFSKWDVTI